MSAPKFQYKKPLVVKLGTGVSGSRNGIRFDYKRIFWLNRPKCNTLYWAGSSHGFKSLQFNNITSSNVIKLGD